MPFSGTGVFNLSFDWNNDAANGIPITASRVQAEDQNIADGLSMCITTDGQSTTTGIIPFASGISTGAGIQFPSVAVPSGNVNNLDDYKEGAWTPIDASVDGLIFTNATGTFIKVGSLVTAWGHLTYPSTASATLAGIGGLPYNTINTIAGSVSSNYPISSSFQLAMLTTQGSNAWSNFKAGVGQASNSDLSGQSIYFTFVYQAG